MGIGSFLFGEDPEKYDPNSPEAKAAQTMGKRGDTLYNQLQGQAKLAMGRTAATSNSVDLARASQMNAARINTSRQNQFREGQMGLMGQLQEQAAGRGPSLATETLRQGAEQNMQQAQALAAGARGGNVASARRAAMEQATNANQNLAGQSAQARIQEQMNARAQLQGVMDSGRGADIGLATSQAGFQQQARMSNMDARNQFALQQGQMDLQNNQFNAGAQNQMTAQNDQYMLGLYGQQGAANQAEMQARMEAHKLATGHLDPGSEGNFGAIASGIGTIAAFSDESLKRQPRRSTFGQIMEGVKGGIASYATTKELLKEDPEAAKKEKAAKDEKFSQQVNASIKDERDRKMKDFLAGRGPHPDAAAAPVRRPDGFVFDPRTGMMTNRPTVAPVPVVPSAPQPVAYGQYVSPAAPMGYSDEKVKEQARQAGYAQAMRTIQGPRGPIEMRVADTSGPHTRYVEGRDGDLIEVREAGTMLDKLTPYTYEYNETAQDKGMPPGRRAGVMAQDLEKSRAGRRLVHEDEDGHKMVDYGSPQGLSTMMAGLAAVNEKVDRLKKGRR